MNTQNNKIMQRRRTSIAFIGKSPGKRKVTAKSLRKKTYKKKDKIKKVLMKKVWTINLKKQWWEYDDYDDAKNKLKLLLDAGCWFGRIDFKQKEVKDDTK